MGAENTEEKSCKSLAAPLCCTEYLCASTVQAGYCPVQLTRELCVGKCYSLIVRDTPIYCLFLCRPPPPFQSKDSSRLDARLCSGMRMFWTAAAANGGDTELRSDPVEGRRVALRFLLEHYLELSINMGCFLSKAACQRTVISYN